VIPAHRIGGRERVVGQAVILRDLPDQRGRGFPVGQLFAQEGVEHRSGGVFGLELVLDVQGGEHVLREADRQVGTVGVVGRPAVLGGGDDAGIALHVVLGQAVGGGLRRGRLQVVQVAVLLLIVAQAGQHVVEHLLGEALRLFMGQVGPDPFGVERRLVHPHQPDGGEMAVKIAQVVPGVGVQALLQQLGDDGALYVERTGGDVHHPVQAAVEVRLVRGHEGDTRHVDCDHADGAGGFAAAEEAARLFPQFAQIQPQPAAHAPHVAGLHVGIDVVAEIGGAVLAGHFKQQPVVLRLRPVKVARNGVGGDGVLEAAAVGVPLDHDLDEGLVDHVHFALAVLVAVILLHAADDAGQLRQVRRHGPVQRDVGKRRLCAPAAGGVDPEDERLDGLLDLFLSQVIRLDERGQVGVKGGEGLRACPLILHDAQEVDHLVAQRRQVPGRLAADLPGNAAQALLDELLERPAGAVAREHAQVMQMDVRVAVGVRDLLVIDLAEPVVGRDGAGIGQDQPAHGVGDRAVLLDPPVRHVDVAVDDVAVVQIGGLHQAQFFPLLAVEDVGLGHVGIPGPGQHAFDAVLNVFDGDQAVLDLCLKVGGHLQRQEIDHVVGRFLLHRVKGFPDGRRDLGDVKCHRLTVALYDLIHSFCLL